MCSKVTTTVMTFSVPLFHLANGRTKLGPEWSEFYKSMVKLREVPIEDSNKSASAVGQLILDHTYGSDSDEFRIIDKINDCMNAICDKYVDALGSQKVCDRCSVERMIKKICSETRMLKGDCDPLNVISAMTAEFKNFSGCTEVFFGAQTSKTTIVAEWPHNPLEREWWRFRDSMKAIRDNPDPDNTCVDKKYPWLYVKNRVVNAISSHSNHDRLSVDKAIDACMSHKVKVLRRNDKESVRNANKTRLNAAMKSIVQILYHRVGEYEWNFDPVAHLNAIVVRRHENISKYSSTHRFRERKNSCENIEMSRIEDVTHPAFPGEEEEAAEVGSPDSDSESNEPVEEEVLKKIMSKVVDLNQRQKAQEFLQACQMKFVEQDEDSGLSFSTKLENAKIAALKGISQILGEIKRKIRKEQVLRQLKAYGANDI